MQLDHILVDLGCLDHLHSRRNLQALGWGQHRRYVLTYLHPLIAGGCPLSHQVLTYSIPNVSDVCVLEPNGTYVAQLGNPSNNYTCGAATACALLRALTWVSLPCAVADAYGLWQAARPTAMLT